MNESARPSAGGQPFEAIDAKLTVFALANGLDLTKTERTRRFEWFSDRLERGLLIGAASEGGFSVRALAWHTKKPDDTRESVAAESVAAGGLMALLNDAIERANEL